MEPTLPLTRSLDSTRRHDNFLRVPRGARAGGDLRAFSASANLAGRNGRRLRHDRLGRLLKPVTGPPATLNHHVDPGHVATQRPLIGAQHVGTLDKVLELRMHMGAAFRLEVGRAVASPIGQRNLAPRNARVRKMSRHLTNTYVSDAEVLGSGPEEAPCFPAARALAS